ncbi:hypothetical protein C8E97_3456 [Saccharothrix australiensis]|uniref:Uncharacterized protein n=1 Tax=Saccharothrix australiensis TaxID=2072 RepID=A0A495W1C3_9PSEU|nr:hypothetical protein C8E97_3456 [Saccharothrix australiensis]
MGGLIGTGGLIAAGGSVAAGGLVGAGGSLAVPTARTSRSDYAPVAAGTPQDDPAHPLGRVNDPRVPARTDLACEKRPLWMLAEDP